MVNLKVVLWSSLLSLVCCVLMQLNPSSLWIVVDWWSFSGLSVSCGYAKGWLSSASHSSCALRIQRGLDSKTLPSRIWAEISLLFQCQGFLLYPGSYIALFINFFLIQIHLIIVFLYGAACWLDWMQFHPLNSISRRRNHRAPPVVASQCTQDAQFAAVSTRIPGAAANDQKAIWSLDVNNPTV